MSEMINDLIGIGNGPQDIGEGEVVLRTIIVYGFAILLIRLGDKRFLGKNTAFDVILGFMLGSVLSRATTGNSALVPTLLAASMLVGLHWLLALSTFRLDSLGNFIKGIPRHLIKDGVRQQSTLHRSHISDHDLRQALRIESGSEDLTAIKDAYLERSGDISIIEKESVPTVVDISVAEGVQVVRIEWREGGS